MKWSPDPARLDEERLSMYAVLCGHTLARAHARSGDAIAISAYLGTGTSFDKAIRAFAESYADQSERDFVAFTAAITDGRISAYEDAGGAEGAAAAQNLRARPG
jgi:deoxyxylulose-5-phosphate synthase